MLWPPNVRISKSPIEGSRIDIEAEVWRGTFDHWTDRPLRSIKNCQLNPFRVLLSGLSMLRKLAELVLTYL